MAIKIQNSTIIDDSRNIVNAGVTTVLVNSTSDALRITQTGSGNALVVEDNTNPDATPFVIGNDGNVGIGTTNATEALTVSGKIQINQNSTSDNRLIFRGQPSSSYRWNIDNYSSANEFRIFREDDATSANGSVAVSISTTGTVTATKFSGDGSLLTNLPGGGGGAGESYWTSTASGIHTLSNVGIGTTNPTSKLSVVGDGNFTGVVTASSFSGNATSSTYATSAGLSTHLKGGSGGQLVYQSGADTTAFLANGTSGFVLQSNGGTNAPSWVAAAPAGAITGLTVRDEGTIVGGANSVSQFNFVGSNISVASTAGIATITVADNLVGTALSISGISTFTNGPVLVGSATSTGTASQPLQVTGGAYVSGNTGIGTTNPVSKLDVRGDITLGTSGINTISSTTDIQSWYYTGKSIPSGSTSPQGMYVGAAGTALYVVSNTSPSDTILQYQLSTPYDVSTAGAATTFFPTATQEQSPTGIDFSPDGTKMFVCGQTPVGLAAGDYVHEYSLSTSWNVAPSSVGYTTSFNVTTQEGSPTGVVIGAAGTAMYVVGGTADTVFQYTLTTPYSLASGVTYASKTLVLSAAPLSETGPQDISFNSTGTVLWVVGSTNDRIYEFRLGTAWDISTAVFYDDVYVGFNETNPLGLHVIPEQNVAYIVGPDSGGDRVFQYSTNTPAIEIASSGISTVSSIVLNNETRVKDNLYVKGNTTVDGNTISQGNLNVEGTTTLSTTTVGATLTANAAVTFDTTTSAINQGTSQTTGTFTIGGTTTATGTITVGRGTTTQTTNIQAGATVSGQQKTINLGTGGLAGSRTLITVGSATAGAISTVTIPSPTNLLIGTATSTGTSSQPLQVTGGAYVSGNLGVGTISPSYKLEVEGSRAWFKPNSDGTEAIALSLGRFSDSNQPFYDIFTNDASGDVATHRINRYTGTWNFRRTSPTGDVNGLSFTSSFTSGTSVSIGNSVGNTQIYLYTNANSYFNNDGAVLVGSATSTNTANQKLQVTGGAYVSGNTGIGTTNPTSKLSVVGDALVTGVVTATTFIGNLTGTATTASSVTVDSVGLGTDTYGDYVKDITGTANQIAVTSGTGEGSSPTLSIPSQFTAPQDVTVTRDLQVNRNLNVNGNITIGGTSATLFTTEFKVYDPDIVLGFRTDGSGNDVSTDNTANHGGIAIASTEGTPLISLYDVGVGETNPATYKKFMWFKSGTFSGLGTDAWLSNYAIGIGSTQVPNGVRLAAGGMQVTDSTLSVPQLNISGVSTFTGAVSFGTSAYFGDNDTLNFGDGNDLKIYHSGSNSFIDEVGTGDLFLRATNIYLQQNGGETALKAIQNGAVELYYDNSKKFETTGVGVTVFGTTETQQLVVSGVSTFQNNVFLGDNDSLYFGDGSDLRIWHNGTHSNIADIGTGDLYLGGNNNVVIADGALSEAKAKFITNGAVELYYDNVKEFETTGYGATVFGTLQSQGLNISGVSTVGFITATNIWNAGITTSSRITLNGANDGATGGGQIYLNGATGNRIDFNTNGVNPPAFSNRSNGTKLVLYPTIGASAVDYAFGIDTNTLWYSIPTATSTAQHRWYAGITTVADLKGSGELVIGSTSLTGTASQRLQVTGGAYVSGSVGIGVTNPQDELHLGAASNIGIRLQDTAPGGGSYATINYNDNGSGTNALTLSADEGNTGTNTEIRFNIDGSEVSRYAVGGELLVGASTTTGTSSQKLQVTGGAYVSGSVGIGTTNPTSKLTVSGDIAATNYNTTSTRTGSETATTTTTSQTAIHTGLASASYRSVEYLVQAVQSTNFHTTKILVVHDDTTAYLTEYGTVFNNATVASYDVDISGGNLRLLATPASSSSTTFKISFTTIVV